MDEKVLITWDVDGTILRSAQNGRTHTSSIKDVALQLYGIPLEVDINEYCGTRFAGTTDSWIAKTIIQKATGKEEVPQEKLDEFEELEDKIYHETFDGRVFIIEGVYNMLKTLSEMPNVTIALCTGNFERIGWTKVAAAGVADFFKDRLGGFGHILERPDILREAIRKSSEVRGCKFDRIIHVGDAATDVNAAKECGVIPVGVETGYLKKEQFPKGCFVIRNLEVDFDDFMSIVKTGKPIHDYINNF